MVKTCNDPQDQETCTIIAVGMAVKLPIMMPGMDPAQFEQDGGTTFNADEPTATQEEKQQADKRNAERAKKQAEGIESQDHNSAEEGTQTKAPKSTKPVVTENGEVVIQHGPNKGQKKKINGYNLKNSSTTRNGKTVERDENGFPVFDSKYDTTVPDELLGNQDAGSHFEYANQTLKADLEKNPELAKEMGLTKEQEEYFLKDPSGKNSPSGLTWHHHQDTGKMQLVDTNEHRAGMPHLGGMAIWGGGYKK
jgi:hypothetical protein